jgi:predicted Kef-type K+ transport protein
MRGLGVKVWWDGRAEHQQERTKDEKAGQLAISILCIEDIVAVICDRLLLGFFLISG